MRILLFFHPPSDSLGLALDVILELLLYVTINVEVVALIASILALMCSYCCLLLLFSFPLLLPFLRILQVSFLFWPLDFPFFWPIFSRNCACTQALSTILGFNNIIYFHRWFCRHPIYLKRISWIFGEIPSMMLIFVNSMVYSYKLFPSL